MISESKRKHIGWYVGLLWKYSKCIGTYRKMQEQSLNTKGSGRPNPHMSWRQWSSPVSRASKWRKAWENKPTFGLSYLLLKTSLKTDFVWDARQNGAEKRNVRLNEDDDDDVSRPRYCDIIWSNNASVVRHHSCEIGRPAIIHIMEIPACLWTPRNHVRLRLNSFLWIRY